MRKTRFRYFREFLKSIKLSLWKKIFYELRGINKVASIETPQREKVVVKLNFIDFSRTTALSSNTRINKLLEFSFVDGILIEYQSEIYGKWSLSTVVWEKLNNSEMKSSKSKVSLKHSWDEPTVDVCLVTVRDCKDSSKF